MWEQSEMGRFSVDVVVANNRDVLLAKPGAGGLEHVRHLRLRGVVDSGAARLVLPAVTSLRIASEPRTTLTPSPAKSTSSPPVALEVPYSAITPPLTNVGSGRTPLTLPQIFGTGSRSGLVPYVMTRALVWCGMSRPMASSRLKRMTPPGPAAT